MCTASLPRGSLPIARPHTVGGRHYPAYVAIEAAATESRVGGRAAILYRLYDGRGRLLYTGITCRGMRRMSEHAEVQPWWPMVRRIDVTHFSGWVEARAAELTAIRSERPLHNKQDTYHWTREGVGRAAVCFLLLFIPLVAAILSLVVLAVGSALASATMTDIWGERVLVPGAMLLATVSYLCDGVGILRTPPSVRIGRMTWARCGLSGATCVALLLVIGPAPTVDMPYVWTLRALYYVAFGLAVPIQLLHMWSRRRVLYDGEGPWAWTVRGRTAMAPLRGVEAARVVVGQEWRRATQIIRR